MTESLKMLADEVARLRAEVAELRRDKEEVVKALHESVTWNWLDKDIDEAGGKEVANIRKVYEKHCPAISTTQAGSSG